MNYSLIKILRFMDNQQHKDKITYRITEHWDVWESHVKKLKDYLSEVTNNDMTFETVNSNKKQNKI